MYNAYIPEDGPYEKIPEDTPLGLTEESSIAPDEKKGGLSSLLNKLGKADTGDLVLLLLLFVLLREDGQSNALLLLALAAAIFLDGED